MATEAAAALNPWIPEKDAIRLAVLGKLLEELGELTAIASRCVIQGVHAREPVTNKLNQTALTDEIADVLAGLTMVSNHLGLDERYIYARVQRKIEHLESWHRLIRGL